VHVCPLTQQRCSTSQRARHIPKENCQKFSSSPLAGNVSEQTNKEQKKEQEIYKKENIQNKIMEHAQPFHPRKVHTRRLIGR
jgi:predicted glycosyl hydrolase (DUF1957 family)